MPLVNTYTTLDDVRRLLRSTPPRGRIRFSESFNILRKYSDNTGTIELSNISINQYYSDVANHKIIFQSDSTTFKMYRIDTEKQTDVLIGSGIKQADFTTDDGYFNIEASKWSGWSFPGDVIEFMTDSHLSYIDASRYIQDAEYFVDSILEKNIRFSTTSEESLRFPLDTTSSVPKAVKLATMYIASYMIYKSIYLENMNEDTRLSIYQGWLQSGIENLSNYAEKWNLALSTSVPVLGNINSNEPMDLDNDFVFKGSQFNLYIPINAMFFSSADADSYQKAYNIVTSDKFKESIVSDIADLCLDSGGL